MSHQQKGKNKWKKQKMQMNAYPGVAQPGMAPQYNAPQGMDSQYNAPQGMDSQYNAPQGMDSQYSAPQGMDSQYSAPQVMYSQYSAPPGIALQYSAQPGMDSQYNDPQGPQYSALPGMAPQGMGINPAGLPSGLAYLATLNEVQAHKIVNIIELVTDLEENNQYEIMNSNNQKFMFAQEDSDECTRNCFGTWRPFAITVRDNFGKPVILVNRPYRCNATCVWCCYLQEMEIQSPPGELQGTVKQVWKFCTSKYRVYNSQNQCVFTIERERWCCRRRTEMVFRVFDGDREEKEVAQIAKRCREIKDMYSGATDFSLRFTTDLDLPQKILLLGATFLIDFNHYEGRYHQQKSGGAGSF